MSDAMFRRALLVAWSIVPFLAGLRATAQGPLTKIDKRNSGYGYGYGYGYGARNDDPFKYGPQTVDKRA